LNPDPNIDFYGTLFITEHAAGGREAINADGQCFGSALTSSQCGSGSGSKTLIRPITLKMLLAILLLVELIHVQVELVAPRKRFGTIAAGVDKGARRKVPALNVVLGVRLLAAHFAAQHAAKLGSTAAAGSSFRRRRRRL
jgi:hypothetical protein